MENENQPVDGRAAVSLTARPERRLIRPSGSHRHVVFTARADERPAAVARERLPLTLGLVLDRSGSMSGAKLDTARQAALALLNRLDARDRVAVVIFDDEIGVLQALTHATPEAKDVLRAKLGGVQAGGSTALHQGWLTGCNAIASEQEPARGQTVAHCMLLTDGLANVGLTDPERIATEAGGVLKKTGISTSTFGIGDYDENLLGPMAVKGGGQFHHLRHTGDIATTFVGEIGDLMGVAASQARLEIEPEAGVTVEVVSAFDVEVVPGRLARWSVALGNLIGGEEKPLVARFGFPPQQGQSSRLARARLVWFEDGAERATDWQTIAFDYASHEACDAEPRDADVMRLVGQHHSWRAQREAMREFKHGDRQNAQRRLRAVSRHIQVYANGDPALLAELQALEEAARETDYKERTYMAQTAMRAQKIHRPPHA